jgi:hypothetical protein
MKKRTKGHSEATISGDTRADLSERSSWFPASRQRTFFTRRSSRVRWDKTRTVLMRTHYWFPHEPCWYVRKKNAPWLGKAARTRRSGFRLPRNLWVARERRDTVIRLKSQRI